MENLFLHIWQVVLLMILLLVIITHKHFVTPFLFYSIIKNQNKMSDVLNQLNAKVDRIVSATNGVAQDIRSIKDQLAGGVTAEDAAALSERLETAAARLEGIDAETPAPAEEENTGG